MYCVCCVARVVFLCGVFLVGALCLTSVGCSLRVSCCACPLRVPLWGCALFVLFALIALSCAERAALQSVCPFVRGFLCP